MAKRFRDLTFSEHREYESSGDNTPLEFYLETFPIAKEIDIFLGYYNSYIFKTLSHVMASFIYNGGSMRIITNEFLSQKDKKNLIENPLNFDSKNIEYRIKRKKLDLDPESSHFYDCLKYLMSKGRLKIQPVKFKKWHPDGLEHKKQLILYDGHDYISTNGSINLTLSALIKNDESFTLDLPWEYEKITNGRINKRRSFFNSILNKTNSDFQYLSASEIISDIDEFSDEKELAQIISESLKLKTSFKIPKEILKLINNSKIKLNEQINDNNEPTFRVGDPPEIKEPYPYQKQAYKNWVKNNYIGLFEMATGTGKTLTSILCLINEYQISKIQRNIFVVPGKDLVRQWSDELNKCNFYFPFMYYSENRKLHEEINSIRAFINSKISPLNIVITYSSFISDKFVKLFKNNFEEFTVIFDEVHKMGAVGTMKSISKMKFGRRIGLSATPLRDWDEQGSNDFIQNFFMSEKPIFQFSMKQAIGKFLCQYNYYPHFCYLEDDEWEEYKKWTKRIPIKPKELTINADAARRRQAVIDKAINKRSVLIKILKELVKKNNISKTLIYCPRGTDETTGEKIIHLIGQYVNRNFKKNKFNDLFFKEDTKDRELLLEDFEKGKVDILYAIKCLDEGVDVKSTKNAIFIASGKNKREFIQRRGRVLRKSPGKKEANIYDIIVLPRNSDYFDEKNFSEKLLVGEFGRLTEFLEISENKLDSIMTIDERLSQIQLSYHLIKELISQNEKRKITENNS